MDYSGDKRARNHDHGRRGVTDSFSRLLALHCLQDVWRCHHPTKRDYTFFSSRHKSNSRLDYILVSDNILNNFIDSEIGLQIWSEHSWVESQFYLKNRTMQRPQWRLNADLMKLEPPRSDLEKELTSYLELNDGCGVNVTFVWDAMKAVIGGKYISLTSSYLKQKRAYRESLLHQIKMLEEQHKCTCHPKVYRRLTEERKKLEALKTTNIQRKILYIKQKYWLKNPKTLKLLAWKVKTRRSSTQIHAVNNADGTRCSLTKDIIGAFRHYYSDLYTSSNPEPTQIREFLSKYFPHKQISAEHLEYLEELVTPEEVASVIKSLKNSKSPGTDGFGAEFYKAYSHHLTDILSRTFNKILTTGALPPSWNTANIVILPKKDRDLQETKYCRISCRRRNTVQFLS